MNAFRCTRKKGQMLADHRQLAPPQVVQHRFCLCFGYVLVHVGRLWQRRLVFPAENVRDLLGKGQRVEGLEENGGYTEVGEAALVRPLNFGG